MRVNEFTVFKNLRHLHTHTHTHTKELTDFVFCWFFFVHEISLRLMNIPQIAHGYLYNNVLLYNVVDCFTAR